MRPPFRLATAALLLGLAACATAPRQIDTRPADAALLAAQSAREAALAAQPDWSFVGRIAVSAGDDGGSGRIEWRQHGDDVAIRLAAPVTRRSWSLIREGGEVRLEGLDGGTRYGRDPQVLLYEATGWLIPFDALGAWVRGARAGADARIEFGPQGRPATLHEGGWTVDYREWDAATPARPLRVFAERDDARVRLAIERWDAATPTP
ncbi:lipoprotein insertase outer membrane protein LolB [Coralloluteibacterium stylophorae]|uniref:Outer-membrane lipoprotein LolB n=1 Tax=Coralloluteibacterium stylophorae TaxID=1776034 RepID=A0AAP2CAG9_9GAMM|nr:lipoprotein insertase outer membrane protein LolB [Coralloluteibacterium stylophorae]MBS7456621.1 lipoprotein insertase outer membrane protein LolB [Coralloluteibacterium stylophorae]